MSKNRKYRRPKTKNVRRSCKINSAETQMLAIPVLEKPKTNILCLPYEIRMQILNDIVKGCPHRPSEMIAGSVSLAGWKYPFMEWKMMSFYKCMEFKEIFPEDIVELFPKEEEREEWKQAIRFKEQCDRTGKDWRLQLAVVQKSYK